MTTKTILRNRLLTEKDFKTHFPILAQNPASEHLSTCMGSTDLLPWERFKRKKKRNVHMIRSYIKIKFTIGYGKIALGGQLEIICLVDWVYRPFRRGRVKGGLAACIMEKSASSRQLPT